MLVQNVVESIGRASATIIECYARRAARRFNPEGPLTLVEDLESEGLLLLYALRPGHDPSRARWETYFSRRLWWRYGELATASWRGSQASLSELPAPRLWRRRLRERPGASLSPARTAVRERLLHLVERVPDDFFDGVDQRVAAQRRSGGRRIHAEPQLGDLARYLQVWPSELSRVVQTLELR